MGRIIGTILTSLKLEGIKWDYQKEGIQKQGEKRGALIINCQNLLLQNVPAVEKLFCLTMFAQHAGIIKAGRL
jgi:hypothetical protein